MHSQTCSRRNEIINQMPQRHAKNAHTNTRTHTHTTNWVWSWVHKTKRCLWNLMLSSSLSFPACYLRSAFSLCCGRILRLVLIYAPCSDTHILTHTNNTWNGIPRYLSTVRSPKSQGGHLGLSQQNVNKASHVHVLVPRCREIFQRLLCCMPRCCIPSWSR